MNKLLLLFLTISLSLFTLTIIPAYAENPTPYNEWDFDITKVDVNQNPTNLEELVISVTALYKGEFPEGTANIYANITDSNGYHHNLFGVIYDEKFPPKFGVNYIGQEMVPQDKEQIIKFLRIMSEPLKEIFLEANPRYKSI